MRKPIDTKVTAEQRAAALKLRFDGNPAGWYANGHGDQPPYHDSHSDGGTYYDHADNEHFDEHYDEKGAVERYRGDPVELVSQQILRLSDMMSRFEAVQKQRVESIATSVTAQLERIEARLSAIEKPR